MVPLRARATLERLGPGRQGGLGYALRLLMLLALEPDELHTIEEVARRYGISRNHLRKIAQTLAQAGFVESLRGRGGGLRLGRAV